MNFERGDLVAFALTTFPLASHKPATTRLITGRLLAYYVSHDRWTVRALNGNAYPVDRLQLSKVLPKH